MWFIGLEVEQETSAPLLDLPLLQMKVTICLQAIPLTAICSQHSLLLLFILQCAI